MGSQYKELPDQCSWILAFSASAWNQSKTSVQLELQSSCSHTGVHIQLMQDHLNALHAARAAFISCENDERIRGALKSNVRGSGEVKYLTGDEVFYKRYDAVQWHGQDGQGTVIGQINQQVLVKHGCFYVRVHPCRLQIIKGTSRTVSQLPETPMKEVYTPSAESGNTVPVCVDAARSNNPSNQSAALPINHPVDIPVLIVESSSPEQQEVARNSSAIGV